MKFLYIHRYSGDSNNGINKKIIAQCKSLKEMGINVKLLLLSDNNSSIPNYQFIESYKFNISSSTHLFKKIIIAQDIADLISKEISYLNKNDIIYTRYPISIFFCRKNFFQRYRLCRLFFEHNTHESKEFKMAGSRLNLILDCIIGKVLINQTSGIVGVTDEITNYEVTRSYNSQKPHITIGNGFEVTTVPVRNISIGIGTTIDILCVANISRWHGIDRLIKGLGIYRGSIKVKLHIVGDGADLKYIQRLTKENRIANQVIFHGFKTGEDLDYLFNTCHIAVGSLGLHRVGLTQSSTLKAREYCARGIPYIIASADPDFPDDFPFILRIPANESAVTINELIEFAQKVYTDLNHPQKMRDYAVENLDWLIKMKKLILFLSHF